MIETSVRQLVFAIAMGCWFVTCGCHWRQEPQNIPEISAEPLQETDILPHMQGEIEQGRNSIYCVCFQIAWDALREMADGEPLRFEDEFELAEVLNANPRAAATIDADAYMTTAGIATDATVAELRRDIQARFGDDSVALTRALPANSVFAFAYLQKVLTFDTAFDVLDHVLRFPTPDGPRVDAFGIAGMSDSERHQSLGKQVAVLSYVNDDNFIVALKSHSVDDEIVLAKVTPGSTLADTIRVVEERIASSTLSDDERALQNYESLVIPVISFGAREEYSELIGKQILNDALSDLRVVQAEQWIRFRLDEHGAVLRARAVISTTSAQPPDLREFVFDRPFLIYLKQRGADVPYFAAWIETTEVLAENAQQVRLD